MCGYLEFGLGSGWSGGKTAKVKTRVNLAIDRLFGHPQIALDFFEQSGADPDNGIFSLAVTMGLPKVHKAQFATITFKSPGRFIKADPPPFRYLAGAEILNVTHLLCRLMADFEPLQNAGRDAQLPQPTRPVAAAAGAKIEDAGLVGEQRDGAVRADPEKFRHLIDSEEGVVWGRVHFSPRRFNHASMLRLPQP